MLAKKYRLPIQLFFKNRPRSFKKGPFLIKIRRTGGLYSRFGVSVGKKVAAKAAKRNQLRRIIYDCIRKKEFHKKPGEDVLITLFPEAGRLGKRELEVALERALL